MAKPRLKVYRAQMGFAEAIVAVSSQKAALDAWGARQNLFAEGLAQLVDEADAVAAATAKPGVVLQRPVGSSGAFAEHLAKGPDLPPAKARPVKAAPPAKAAAPVKAAPPAKPKPDRSRLTAAEAALAQIELDATAAASDIALRRKQLDEEEAAMLRKTDALRRTAQRRLDEARRAFDAA